ncbi:hypothetical protein HPB50_009771 [Hyalomma asiaticum]|uniref:Uncharacterized protein n=1 Tax=Hyalomma asiaticum TaxID=266040 RepID=A0ACB7S1E4_HYAAI|nr:hypothetical protein HPB50_009771 [Hyalomma asiaticum]
MPAVHVLQLRDMKALSLFPCRALSALCGRPDYVAPSRRRVTTGMVLKSVPRAATAVLASLGRACMDEQKQLERSYTICRQLLLRSLGSFPHSRFLDPPPRRTTS